MASICREAFTCTRDDLQIRGDVFSLENSTREPESIPDAIICHGFMSNRRTTYPYARTLATAGYTTWCFDFCGGGIPCESDGATTDMSALTEVEDLRAVLTYVQSQHEFATKPLLAGCSQGGLVAALLAAELGDTIRGLALLYPALTIPDDARAGTMLGMNFDPEHIPQDLHSGHMTIGQHYVTDVRDMDAYAEISAYTGRVLIIHGEKDSIVPVASSRRAERAYRDAGADVQLVVLPRADHGFRGENQRTAEAILSNFARSLV